MGQVDQCLPKTKFKIMQFWVGRKFRRKKKNSSNFREIPVDGKKFSWTNVELKKGWSIHGIITSGHHLAPDFCSYSKSTSHNITNYDNGSGFRSTSQGSKGSSIQSIQENHLWLQIPPFAPIYGAECLLLHLAHHFVQCKPGIFLARESRIKPGLGAMHRRSFMNGPTLVRKHLKA